MIPTRGAAGVAAVAGGSLVGEQVWPLRRLLFHVSLLLCLFLHSMLPRAPLPGGLRHAPRAPYAGEYISFNVILTSVGRSTLARMLGTFAHQLTRHDFISVLSDIDPSNTELIRATNATLHAAACHGCTKIFRQNDPPLGAIGHRSRTVHQVTLPGAFHMHADDDDFYTPDAFEIIRSVVTTLVPRVYIFRVVKENYYPAKNRKELIAFPVLDNNNPLAVGLYNGGTPCGVVRNVGAELPIWRPTIGGDAVFWEDAIHVIGIDSTIMVPRVIYMVNEWLYERLTELGIDQPKGKMFADETGRLLPNGNPIMSAPSQNKVDLVPNPLLALKARVRDGVLLPTGPRGLPIE